MTDALISLLSVIVGLIILRSRGGEGLNIKFHLASISTPQGKKDHIVVWVALMVMFTGIVHYFLHQREEDIIPLFIVPFMLSGLMTLLLASKSKK